MEPFIEHRWEPRHFWLRRPRPVGSRFLILRGDRNPPRGPAHSGRIPILLDLRQAFGSGGHGTTEGCLLALEGTVRGGERVLDLGTGSGILAIAAWKLGASRVTALDIRASACREAEAPSFESYLLRFPLEPVSRIAVRGRVTRVCRRRPGGPGTTGPTRPSGSGLPG